MSSPEDSVKSKEGRKEGNEICTYIHKLRTNQHESQLKFRTTIEVDSSIHDAVRLIASLLGTTATNLYIEGVLRHLETLIPKLPENIQVNIMRQINVRHEADPEIVGLKIDIAYEQLAYWMKRIKTSPNNVWIKDHLRKQLSQTMKLASTSGNEALKQLVIEARELLRGCPV